MKYYLNTKSSINGLFPINTWLIAADMTNQCTVENFIDAYRSFLSFLSERFNLTFGIIVYHENKYGFSRLERYKGLSLEKIKISDENAWKDFFCKGDSQDEYMYACIKLNPKYAKTLLFNNHYSLMFLATDSEFEDVVSSIPKLKTLKNVKKYMLNQGVILTQSYCIMETPDGIDGAAWLISSPERTKKFWYQFQDVIKVYDLNAVFEEDYN